MYRSSGRGTLHQRGQPSDKVYPVLQLYLKDFGRKQLWHGFQKNYTGMAARSLHRPLVACRSFCIAGLRSVIDAVGQAIADVEKIVLRDFPHTTVLTPGVCIREAMFRIGPEDLMVRGPTQVTAAEVSHLRAMERPWHHRRGSTDRLLMLQPVLCTYGTCNSTQVYL